MYEQSLYKVLTFMSWKTAKTDYEIAVNEEQRKKVNNGI